MHAPSSTSPVLRWRAVGAALLTLALTGCPSGPDPDPDPDSPPPMVDDGEQLARDPACTLTGDLALELVEGNGAFDFKPLTPGEGPAVHSGPQGGTHLELGVRVANPASEFPGLWVKFYAESRECGVVGCGSFILRGQYGSVMRDAERFLPQEGGATVVSGIIVFVNAWPEGAHRRITVWAADRCGRTGTTVWDISPGTP